ncbi:MAG: endopeptidase La [Bacteroidales bacterium]|nr:endopeptidase La [Bacteroidales bacterium]MDD4670439.1 endopeptidase La [Bacteroidales bacterium]
MKDILDTIFSENAPEVNIIPVMNFDPAQKLTDSEMPVILPVLPLRNAILFPETVIPIAVGRDKSIKLINESFKSNKLIGAVTQIDAKIEDPSPKDLFDTGTLGRIIKVIEMPDNTVTAIVQGIKRFHVDSINITVPYLMANITYLNDIVPDKNDTDMEAVAGSIKDAALHLIKLTPNLPQEAGFAIKNIDGYEFLINFIASSIEIDNTLDKVDLLRENILKDRALKLLELLNKQIEILKIKDDIQKKVKSEIDHQQREYYLNNQLKTIQEELGIAGDDQDFSEFRKKAKDKKWPAYVAEAFEKELQKLERTNPNSPDFNIQYSYVQFLIDLPWDETTPDNLDLKNAQKVLDEDHYGLEKVKERIIEYLAVLKLKGDMKSPILCLYGPPGVGKTSLGKSIARALGRNYGRISLGGLHDESEIRGHRRTYIGAMPGRIIQTIKKVNSSNPVIVLDEIDKVSDDFHGDPASALLEVLDPEQNTAFHDNYLDIDYDLSKVLFITTANNISSIHPALLDRMELISVSGYIPQEKVAIAKGYLIPKQLEAHGLKDVDLQFSDEAIDTIIDEYTRESGVRGLDKQIAKVARITAKKIALEEEHKQVMGGNEIKDYLGLPTNMHDLQQGNEAPGVVTGLAWTETGGEILFVECSLSDEGKGSLSTTGNLGDVMKESAMIALQYLKAHPDLTMVKPKVFYEKDIHIHVPEGAIPKDGPSAGITMVSAIASALRGRSIKSGIAMTGEITLRGKVLPVGGIKEKILAAKRAGVHTIVLSKENERDIREIKDIYLEGLVFKYVNTIDEVLEYVFSK